MSATFYQWVAVLSLLLAALFVLLGWWRRNYAPIITAATAFFALAAIIVLFAQEPVCHVVTEDSVITDCDYRDGGWWQE